MPFPLAHPAAVLPLRRFCPRHLSFLALVVGSLVPDTGYLLDDLGQFPRFLVFLLGPATRHLDPVWMGADWDDVSHVFVGSLLYCLPVGLLILSVVSWLRFSLVATLPQPHREALLPLCQGSPASFPISVVSLLVGVWLHIAWDQFTSDERWLASRWEFLHWPVAHLGAAPIEMSRLLWLVSTVGGVLILARAYARFLQRHQAARPAGSSDPTRRRLWVALIVAPAFLAAALAWPSPGAPGPVTAVLGLAHRFGGLYLAVFCGCLIVVALIAKANPGGFGRDR